MALALFAVTLFVSAFILFLVQPIIGKLILPKLGGTPQVWNTCMVFFQTVLLLGYFYTHTSSTRLSLRRQLIVHGVLLVLPFLILLPNGPFNIEGWVPTLGANPLFSTLLLLTAVVGVPFFVVATSAPLLQKWFAYTGHPAAKDPYFLYSASNVGSMLALLLYPFFIEQVLDLKPQAWLYTFGYMLLAVLFVSCAALVWNPVGGMKARLAEAPQPIPEPAPASEGQPIAPVPPDTPPSTDITANPPPAPAPAAPQTTGIKKGKPPQPRQPGKLAAEPVSIKASDEMTTWRRLRWIGLAAVPVSLMLGVTTHITTDLSPIPLFWLIPLTLYLLSFILVFSRWPWVWTEQPHTYMLYLQPVAICLMLFMEYIAPFSAMNMWVPIFFNVLAFFMTALVCHGEMAKDRPSTKHLTEFYLLMSFGGMVGGMFNGILAPVIFVYVWEFSIAVIAACFLRPKLKEGGWADDMVANVLNPKPAAAPVAKGPKGAKAPHHVPVSSPGTNYTPVLDYALPVLVTILTVGLVFAFASGSGSGESQDLGTQTMLAFGIPLVIAALFFARPLRFGLTIAAIIIVHAMYEKRGDSNIFADRSYFGILRVKVQADYKHTNKLKLSEPLYYTTLIHGHINHGMNLLKPKNKNDWFQEKKDFSRLATTYYHRYGPAGIAMEKFNWFPGPQNTYWADARLPASIWGAGSSFMAPMDQLSALWSEPPYATIGLGTGTMASYGRPFQHVHYYEIDNHVRRLNLPLGRNEYYLTLGAESLAREADFVYDNYKDRGGNRTYFTYLKDAIQRGCEVEVLMGDARLRMALPYQNFHEKPDRAGGPMNFYHLMVVDAFSSDAIPVHLLTEQAFKMYFDRLTKDGVLCVHTSNRYVSLPKVVAAVASKLNLAYIRGHDGNPANEELGRFTSEWVMVARHADYLRHLKAPPGYVEEVRKENIERRRKNLREVKEAYWGPVDSNARYAWTDDHSNLVDVLRRAGEED